MCLWISTLLCGYDDERQWNAVVVVRLKRSVMCAADSQHRSEQRTTHAHNTLGARAALSLSLSLSFLVMLLFKQPTLSLSLSRGAERAEKRRKECFHKKRRRRRQRRHIFFWITRSISRTACGPSHVQMLNHHSMIFFFLSSPSNEEGVSQSHLQPSGIARSSIRSRVTST